MKNDLTNKRFGNLLVLKLDTEKRKDKHYYWICKCDCGKTISVRSTYLRNGTITSCGCTKKYFNNNKIKDISNQRFGNLIALYPTDKRAGTHVIWHCKCDCGKELDVNSNSLCRGLTTSCGCSNSSKGEKAIEFLLKENKINFVKEKTFDTCISPITKAKLRFDFYVNNKYIIEYDGVQHFKENKFFKGTLKERQFIDECKNNWCKQNNIIIIRIPYTHLNKLVIKDLLISSNYKVN